MIIMTTLTAYTTREITNAMKLAVGCSECGYKRSAAALQFDHLDPSTKYRTRYGNIVHPSDMIKGDRYSLQTVLAEIAKCRVLCANCHAEFTHDEQREG
jgi:DNA-directed RNA polymerase subunit RPC12/RpoP